MANVAKIDLTAGGDAYVEKTGIAADSGYSWECDFYFPSATTKGGVGGSGFDPDVLEVLTSDGGGFGDSIYPFSDSGTWKWTDSPNEGGIVIFDGWFTLKGIGALDGPDGGGQYKWLLEWLQNSASMFGPTDIFDIHEDGSSVASTLRAGGRFGGTTGVYYMRNLVMKDHTGAVIFSDPFDTDFSAWDGGAPLGAGSLTIVDDSDIPAPIITITTPVHRQYRTAVINKSDFRVLTLLDGLAANRELTRALRIDHKYTFTAPSDHPQVNIPHTDDLPFVEEGVRLVVVLRRQNEGLTGRRWEPVGGGEILNVADRLDGDVARTDVVVYGPRNWLRRRPVYIDDSGTFPQSAGYSFPTETPVSIQAATLLARTIAADGACLIDAGTDYGGTIHWTGTIDPSCAAVPLLYDQGEMIGDAWDKIEATGACDIVLKPIYDPVNRPGYIADLSIVPFQTDFQYGAIFSWDKFPRNIIDLNRLKDGTLRANKVQMFDDNGNPATPVTNGPSITKYGPSWATQTWPGQDDSDGIEALETLQLLLRKEGRTTVSLTPAPEDAPEPFVEYREGTQVPVYASKRFRRPMSGLQRIWGFVIQPSDDGVETVAQLITSADGLDG